MEMTVEKTNVMKNLKTGIANTYYDRSKTTGLSKLFKLFW
jgi:hypothetical protein